MKINERKLLQYYHYLDLSIYCIDRETIKFLSFSKLSIESWNVESPLDKISGAWGNSDAYRSSKDEAVEEQ